MFTKNIVFVNVRSLRDSPGECVELKRGYGLFARPKVTAPCQKQMFIENRIKILKSRNEQILEDKINEISNNQNQFGLSKRG